MFFGLNFYYKYSIKTRLRLLFVNLVKIFIRLQVASLNDCFVYLMFTFSLWFCICILMALDSKPFNGFAFASLSGFL